MAKSLSILLTCFLMVFSFKAMSQNQVTIIHVEDLDKGDSFLTGVTPQGVFMERAGKQDRFITDDASRTTHSATVWFERGDNWSSFPGSPETFALGELPEADLGVLSYLSDSLVFFALKESHPAADAGAIASVRMLRAAFDQLKPIFTPPEGSRAIHPAISPDGTQLVFACNMPGGAGGFDLYYCNRQQDRQWSDPVWMGPVVNTTGNEVFPSWNGDQLCFSSDTHAGKGGLDLYYSERSSQWREIKRFEEPYNSKEDDFLLCWLDEETALFNSSRSGKDAVYRAYVVSDLPLVTQLKAVLECAGTPVQNAVVSITNELGEKVVNGNTGSTGEFSIELLELNQKYRAQFQNVSPEVLRRSLLYIEDEFGNRVMVFSPSGDGSFYFELLPFDDRGNLRLVDNIDESSLLSVSVEGQVFEEQPGDVDEGEPIYILDENGELMALAYTTSKGKFKFDELSPNASYTFRLDEGSAVLNMVIYDRGEEIVVPVKEGQAIYERVAPGEALRLTDEDGDEITIRNDDLFVIEHIYYALDSYALNTVARYQLDQLASILVANPEIRLELGSHTDSRGESDYNLRLSERRANAAIEFMISRGVEAARMQGTGYGETALLNHCIDGITCTEEEHAMNRRTEIRIVIR